MKIVVDANIIIASLIKDSKTREILLYEEFEFICPDFILEEIYKYEKYICDKAELTKEDFELLITLIFENVKIIPYEEYIIDLEKAKNIIKEDLKDAPYIACFYALKCEGIWTNDLHYQNKGIKLFTTNDLIKIIQC